MSRRGDSDRDPGQKLKGGPMRAHRSRLSLVTIIALVLGGAWFASSDVRGQAATQPWRTTFVAAAAPIKAAGDYRGQAGHPLVHFESFSALCLEPSTSALFTIAKKD